MDQFKYVFSQSAVFSLSFLFFSFSSTRNVWFNVLFIVIDLVLSIDVMDLAGEHQNDVDHSIFKTRLDTTGSPIHVSKGGWIFFC